MDVKKPNFSIQLEEIGRRIDELRKEKGYTVKDIQSAMGFEQPQAIYKWLRGKSLPSTDNLLILSYLFHVSINYILVGDEDFSLSGFRCVRNKKGWWRDGFSPAMDEKDWNMPLGSNRILAA